MLSFKFRSFEDLKPQIEKKPSLKGFVSIVSLSALFAAVFLHVVFNHFLQKQEFNVMQLQKKIEQSKDKVKSQDLSRMIKNLSLKQMLLRQVLMHVINDFASGIFWQRIFMEKGKIFLVGYVATISALTFFLKASKKSKCDFKLQYIKKSAENFEFQLYVA